MNPKLLNPAVQEYIGANLYSDVNRLALSGSPFSGISPKELISQIESKKKCRDKLPLWFHTPGIYYPPPVSVEQASSEAAAAYKASVARGERLADLTGGMGVDTYFLAKQFDQVLHIERSAALSAIARHNFRQLNAENIQCLAGDGLELLRQLPEQDCIYLDPSRRPGGSQRVFLPSACEPDLSTCLPELLEKSGKIILKTSPLIDLKYGIRIFPGVSAVHVVAVKNDCKEVLWEIREDTDPASPPVIKCVDLDKSGPGIYLFDLEAEARAQADTGFPEKFLYEPSNALLKAGAFNSLAQSYRLRKLHKHSHLYTNSELLRDFPGKKFEITGVLSIREFGKRYQKKAIRISTRNFPLGVPALKKKYKLKEDGPEHAFFTTLPGDKYAVILVVSC